MKKIGGIQFFIGVAVGAVVFGGSVALASGIMAQPKTAGVVIDGNPYDLKGYVVEGSHYFQLRDLATALRLSGKDFSVAWDGQGNRVVIDTSRGYDPNEQYSYPTQAQASHVAQDSVPVQESAMDVEEIKLEIVRLINIERAKAGISALQILPELMDCAQAKADDMVENRYFGHTSPVYGTSGEMIKSFVPESKSRGENLATWRRTPEEVIEGLYNSPSHLENALNPRDTHIGIGIAMAAGGGFACVQHFVRI